MIEITLKALLPTIFLGLIIRKVSLYFILASISCLLNAIISYINSGRHPHAPIEFIEPIIIIGIGVLSIPVLAAIKKAILERQEADKHNTGKQEEKV